MINNSSTLIHCICERFSAKKDVAAAFVWLHYRLEEMNCIYNRLLLNNLKVISQKYGHNI